MLRRPCRASPRSAVASQSSRGRLHHRHAISCGRPPPPKPVAERQQYRHGPSCTDQTPKGRSSSRWSLCCRAKPPMRVATSSHQLSTPSFVIELILREEGAYYDEERLFGNALSSMPLSFNVFAPLAMDLELASAVFRRLLPDFVSNVLQLSLRNITWSARSPLPQRRHRLRSRASMSSLPRASRQRSSSKSNTVKLWKAPLRDSANDTTRLHVRSASSSTQTPHRSGP